MQHLTRHVGRKKNSLSLKCVEFRVNISRHWSSTILEFIVTVDKIT